MLSSPFPHKFICGNTSASVWYPLYPTKEFWHANTFTGKGTFVPLLQESTCCHHGSVQICARDTAGTSTCSLVKENQAWKEGQDLVDSATTKPVSSQAKTMLFPAVSPATWFFPFYLPSRSSCAVLPLMPIIWYPTLHGPNFSPLFTFETTQKVAGPVECVF